MNAPTDPKHLRPTTRTTTVFTSGNSQAVRLPKEFRLKSKTVEISRRGSEIVLREKPLLVRDVLRGLKPLTEAQAREIEQIFASLEDPPPQERDWDELLGATPSRPSKKKTRRA